MHLNQAENFKISKFWGEHAPDPQKGLSRLEKFFVHPTFKMESQAVPFGACEEFITGDPALHWT